MATAIKRRLDGRAALVAAGRIGWVLVFLGLWEALPRLGMVPRIVLAPPTAVVAAAVSDWAIYLDGLKVTVLEAAGAVALSWTFGLGLGMMVGSSLRRTRFAVPLLESALAMPWIVLYPIVVLWLGVGSSSKVLYGVLGATFPILLTTIAAVSTVEAKCILLARSLGATRLQMYTKVLAPFALPQIMSGLRLGTAAAVVLVINSELLISTAGLGNIITSSRATFATGHVYLGLLISVVLAIGSNWLLQSAERRFAWWSGASR